jgi:hypothetical protein
LPPRRSESPIERKPLELSFHLDRLVRLTGWRAPA